MAAAMTLARICTPGAFLHMRRARPQISNAQYITQTLHSWIHRLIAETNQSWLLKGYDVSSAQNYTFVIY